MRYIILLLFIISPFYFLAAQDILFVRSTSRVYDVPDSKGKAIGVYARGGTATHLKKLDNGWSKILVENGDTAYIPSSVLANTLNGRDNYEKDPNDFVLPGEKDAEYGSPHLFIIAAGVKARAIFAKNKPIGKIYRTNEPVGVSYLPYDENKLVKIGHAAFAGDRSGMLFTQRKFLGRRLNFEKMMSEYNAIPKNDRAKRKTMAERIYEMSWRENKTKNLLGIQTFRKYLQETGNEQLYQQLAFEEFLLKATQGADTEKTTAFDKEPARFTVLGQMLPVNFTEKDVLDIPLSRRIITNGSDYPECGVEVTKEYAFDHFKVYHSKTDSLIYIPEIRFNKKEITVTIAGLLIDGNTSEELFVKKLGRFVHYNWLEEPHKYTIGGDGDAFIFHFKNGKVVFMEYFFYC